MMDMPMSTGSGVVPTYSLNDGNNNNGYGNGMWGEWIWIIVLFALFFNRNGFGFGGNGTESINCGRGVASPEDVNSAFNFNQLDNGIRGLERGICDLGYQNQNSIQQLSSQLANCCCENRMTTMQAQFDNQTAINGVSSQLSSCCCDIEKAISDQNFLNAQNTNAIIQANNDNTRAILDKMCQTEIQSLRDQNQAYAMQLSQQAQTANLLEQLQPVSKPAYITCSPYQSAMFPFGGYGFNGFGFNNGCGCGCGCNNI